MEPWSALPLHSAEPGIAGADRPAESPSTASRSSWAQAIETLMGPSRPTFGSNTLGGRVIRAGETIYPMTLMGEPAQRLLDGLSGPTDPNRRIVMRICYCSVFDQCWITDSANARAEPEHVEKCPDLGDEEFLSKDARPIAAGSRSTNARQSRVRLHSYRLVPFFRRHLLYRLAEGPDVTFGIDGAIGAIAVELCRRFHGDLRARLARALAMGVNVVVIWTCTVCVLRPSIDAGLLCMELHSEATMMRPSPKRISECASSSSGPRMTIDCSKPKASSSQRSAFFGSL
jgi:hypothetical protein